MSGLIDTIVRRRRASASSRLAPPAHVLEALPWGETGEPPPVNGHPPASINGNGAHTVPGEAADAVNGGAAETVNGHAPPEVVADEPAPLLAEPEAAEPESEPEPEAAEPEPAEPEPAEPEAAPVIEELEQPTTTFAAVDPAPPEPRPADQLEYPSLRERTALRRRARYLAAVREVQLRDLGGFLLELHRFGRSRPDLVEAKLTATAATDSELRALHHRLDEEAPIGELRQPGIGGACEVCGAVHGSLDRFCASCGEPLR